MTDAGTTTRTEPVSRSSGLLDAAVERDGVQAMMEALSTDEWTALSDPSMPVRHLRACQGHVPKALASLRATLQWRRDFDVHGRALPFPDEILEFDTYNGVSIRLDRDNNPDQITHPDAFRQHLEASLQQWKTDGRKGVWIYVPTAHADLVPIATKLGFQFHMVNAQGLLILSTWLPATPSRLPRGPMYQVGVGCLLLHPHNASQMLVVQETTGPAAAAKLWKMPTGLADPAEDIHQAAQRELLEETGLHATCDGILAFRQSHATRAGTRAASDLFFVCRMRLVDDDKLDLRAQPEEIADIRWMPVTEFCHQDIWQASPLYAKLNSVCLRAAAGDGHLFAPTKLPVGFKYANNVTNTLYGFPDDESSF